MKNKLVIKKGSKNALAPNVVGGGIAIPIGNNMYYMKGRKHEQGGIDIGPNNNNGLEVEGEEVVQVKPNELKVFSSVPFLRGNSPAELVLGGANPNTVFNAQERYKDINRLNDDGTKYKIGGRKKAELGTENDISKYGNSEFLDNWNIARLSTGRFNDQLGDNKLERQKESRDSAKVYTNPKVFGMISAKNEFINRYGNDNTKLSNNMKDIIGRSKTIQNYINKDNIGGTYYPAGHTLYIKPDSYILDNTIFEHEAAHASNANEQENKISEITGYNSDSPYLFKPTEIYSRMTQFRKANNINPLTVWDKDAIKELRNNSKDYNLFNIFDDDTMIRLFNEVASVNNNNLTNPYVDTNKTYITKYGGNINNKKRYGGGMNYIINGNVKNSLRHIRPKAKLGDDKFIPGEDYEIITDADFDSIVGKPIISLDENSSKIIKGKPGDIYMYRNQSFILNNDGSLSPYSGKNYSKTSIPKSYELSTILSKANPNAILDAVTAKEWMYNRNAIINHKMMENINDAINNTVSNNVTSNNVTSNTNNRVNAQYVPNPNLVDIPQLNVGNIATYFYTPKTNSTPRKGKTTTSSSTNLVKSIPDNTSLAVTYTQPDKISIPRFTENIYKRPSLSTLAKEIEDVDFIDIPKQSTKPGLKDRIKYRLNNIFGDFTTNDWLDLGANTASSLISSIASGAILNNIPNVSLPTMAVTQMSALPEITVEELKELEKPATVTAAKLKTRYNINPRLAEIEDTLRRNINEIDRNTADSRVALARKQRASISSQQAKNQLEGQKENIETELINRDRLNQQQVALQNVNAYNQWTQAKAQQALANANLKLAADRANIANKLAVNQYNTTAQNAASQFNTTNKIQEILYNSQLDQLKRQGRINNINNVFGNIVGTFSNILTRQEQRNALRRNIELMRTLAPDVPDEKLLSSVVQFLQS